MRKIYYHKLIRDNIPAKIKAGGSELEAFRLKPKEFEVELLKKVGEEASGLLNAKTKDDMVSELADVGAVIDEVMRLKRIDPKEVSKRKKEFLKKKGGFEKRLFLVWSLDNGYRTNERKYKRHKAGT